MDDSDSLRLRQLWFFDEPAQIIWVASQQHDRAFQFKRRGGNDSIDGTTMARKACRPEQLARPACDLSSHWHDGDPREHPMHSRITRTTPENFRQGNRAHGEPRAPRAGGVQMGTCARITRCQF